MKAETFQKRAAEAITDDLRDRTSDSERRKTELAVVGRAYRTAADIKVLISGDPSGRRGANSMVLKGEHGHPVAVEFSQQSREVLEFDEIRLSEGRVDVAEAANLVETIDRAGRMRYRAPGDVLTAIPFLDYIHLDPKNLPKRLLAAADLLYRYKGDKLIEFAKALVVLAAYEGQLKIPEFPDGWTELEMNRCLIKLMADQHVRGLGIPVGEDEGGDADEDEGGGEREREGEGEGDGEDEGGEEGEPEGGAPEDDEAEKKKAEEEKGKEDLRVLKWLLGCRLFYDLYKDEPKEKTFSERLDGMLDKVLAIIEKNPRFRERCMEAIENLLHAADHTLIIGAARQPYRMVNKLKRFTEQEWWRRYIRNYETLRDQMEPDEFEKMVKGQLRDFPDPMAELERRLARGREFLEQYPNPPDPMLERSMLHESGIMDFNHQLHRDQGVFNETAADYRVHAIAGQCMAELAWMKAFKVDIDEMKHLWYEDFPVQFMEKQAMTCFTAPWMLASMLIQAGIDFRRLFYCNVNQTTDGTIGGHGTLAILNGDEVLLLDINGSRPIMTINTHYFVVLGREDKESADELGGMFLKGDRGVARFRAHDIYTRIAGGHPDMQIMQVTEGLSAEHLTHVGLSFRHEGKIPEADYAFERALGFNPRSPQILYYRGILAFEQGDYKNAYKYLKRSVTEFPNNMSAWFALGELAMVQGHYPTARKHFKRVAKSEVKIYQGEHLIERAKKYVSHKDNADMHSAWEEDFQGQPEVALTA